MTSRFEPLVPSTMISIAPSKIFTYPTRLADSWTPNIQEIYLPGYKEERAAIEIAIHQGSTRSLETKQKGFKGRIKGMRKRLLPEIRMQDAYIYDSRYELDDNIAHVVDSIISPVLAARKVYPQITVILRANATPMAREVFKLLGIPILCTNSRVVGKLVILKQPGRDRFYGDGLYAAFFKDLSFNGFNQVTPDRIFISRRRTRRIINEDEVEHLLKGCGFQKTYFEDIPVAEQWSLARNARAIVGIHGAALSSVLFNQSAAKVIELFHPGFLTNWCRHITNAAGGAWCGVTGQLPPDIIKRIDYEQKAQYFAFHDMRIDITSLRMALERAEIE